MQRKPTKRLLLPSQYYWSHEGRTLEHHPSNQFVLGEMIKSQPCWVHFDSKGSQKPKTLIIADWTAKEWLFSKTKAVQSKCAELIKNQFTLYIWQNGQVVPLTEGSYYSLFTKFVKGGIKPAKKSVIEDAAIKQHSLSRDQILVLDDFEIDCLLDPTLNQRSMSVSDFILLRYQLDGREPDPKKTSSFLKQLDKPIQKIIINSNNSPERIKELQNLIT